MNHLQKLRIATAVKWVLSYSTQNNPRSSKSTLFPTESLPILQNPRFYGQKSALKSVDGHNLDERLTRDSKNAGEISDSMWLKAQAALEDYLHSTRSLDFLDAQHISRNSPRFLEKLLKSVGNDKNVDNSVTRFLRYHPVNEFEPFFESLGLRPCEYISFIPRNLMFLTDDKVLLDNYHALCGYGIARNRIGKIFKEANKVFRYGHGVLGSKLQSFQGLGFSQFTVVKLVTSFPYLLSGDANEDILKVFEKLETLGIDHDWIWEHLSEVNSYNWSRMLKLLDLFCKLGSGKEQLGGLLPKHPTVLLKDSGSITIALIGFLLKFGASADDIISMFLQFPQVQVQKYVLNFRRCYHFLIDIKMDFEDIAWLVCSYPVLLGSCSLKNLKNIQNRLRSGKQRICKIIKKNPQELKNWVVGSRIKPLPPSNERTLEKNKFLLGLGYVENSSEMRKALKVFRGNGEELQERFDCLVNAGLNREDVLKLLKVAPHTVNQSKDAVEAKINFLVNDLGYHVSCLLSFPAYLSYTIQRVKLRFAMYHWLKDEGTIKELSWTTIVSCSNDSFIRQRVSLHPKGPEVWKQLKKQIYSE